MQVNAAPTRTPRKGFSNAMKRLRKPSISASPETALDIASMPNISVANPSKIVPVSFDFCFFDIISITMPKSASIGTKDDGLSIFTQTLSPLMPVRLSIHPVTVVPTFAPIITFVACFSVISPEFTKPTTITVVADEL